MKSQAYSYIRFSSPQQADSNSIERQTKITAMWCERNGIELNKSTFADLGKSGHKRDDLDNYALGEFIRLVETKKIAAGSYLVVENLDRISREKPIVAVNRFTGLLLAGVKVVQLTPFEKVYDSDASMPDLMGAVMEFGRSNSESASKVFRSGSNWLNKRKQAQETKKVMTRQVPGWFEKDNDGKTILPLVVNLKRKAVVLRIFEEAEKGYGTARIATRLNAEKIPTFPGGGKRHATKWNGPVVYNILTNRSVVGEFRPCIGTKKNRKPSGIVVQDYFPSVIEVNQFERVQRDLAKRSKAGRTAREGHVNLFARMLFDCRDGGSFTAKHANDRESVYVPVNSINGKGGLFTSFPVKPFEYAILSKLQELSADDILGNGNDTKLKNLKSELQEVEAGVKALASKIKAKPILAATLGDVLADQQEKVEELRLKVSEAEQTASTPLSNSWEDFHATNLLNDTDDNRMKLKAALNRIISEVYVLFFRQGRAGRTRLALVQVNFIGGATRGYIVNHRGAGHHNDPSNTEVISWRDEVGGMKKRNLADLDLASEEFRSQLEDMEKGLWFGFSGENKTV
jgi:DNA invertase Pin-like site-specific DNA recombinase